jgi:hypothetical protein
LLSRYSFEEAVKEVEAFNVLRRLEDDHNGGFWDSKDAVIGLTRSKATFWLGSSDSHPEETVGRYPDV